MDFTEFTSVLKIYPPEHIVFVGLGNEYRNDDAAGLLFLKELKTISHFKQSYFIEAHRNPENYLEVILRYNPQAVIFIDAAEWEGTPGEIKWIQPDESSSIRFSTHTFSIKLIEQYLSAFKNIDFFYLGIQVLDIHEGMEISPAVKSGLEGFFRDA